MRGTLVRQKLQEFQAGTETDELPHPRGHRGQVWGPGASAACGRGPCWPRNGSHTSKQKRQRTRLRPQ